MDLPSLKHFTPDRISSDPVEALTGEAWVPAIYTDHGWFTADGCSLLASVEDWRDAAEERVVEANDLKQHQNRNESRQAPKASRSNRAIKSR